MGRDKGLLPVPGGTEPIVEALIRRGRDAGLDSVLVGDAAPYAHLAAGVTRVDDEPPGAGPLAGLHAAARHTLVHGGSHVVAVACDMPHVTTEAILQTCAHPSTAVVVAPQRGPGAPWEPMLARYDAAQLVDVLADAISQGTRSFQRLFASIEVEALPLTPAIERALADWDTPDDIAR
jgi:molybdopterin-guanine dinucleotide biosynthesis protein A